MNNQYKAAENNVNGDTMSTTETNAEIDTQINEQTVTRTWRGRYLTYMQISVVCMILFTAIYNLSTDCGDANLWKEVLSTSVGYLLPKPAFQTQTNKSLNLDI